MNGLAKLALLGKCGGWDLRDHDVFTRIWNQLDLSTLQNEDNKIVLPEPKKTKLLKQLRLSLPAQNVAELTEHINWYEVSFESHWES